MTQDTEEDACPICLVPFKPDDLCASDIELLTCHAACLEGSPVVDLNTGEPTDGPISTYRYGPVSDLHHILVEFANAIEGASHEKRAEYLAVFTDRINALFVRADEPSQ